MDDFDPKALGLTEVSAQPSSDASGFDPQALGLKEVSSPAAVPARLGLGVAQGVENMAGVGGWGLVDAYMGHISDQFQKIQTGLQGAYWEARDELGIARPTAPTGPEVMKDLKPNPISEVANVAQQFGAQSAEAAQQDVAGLQQQQQAMGGGKAGEIASGVGNAVGSAVPFLALAHAGLAGAGLGGGALTAGNTYEDFKDAIGPEAAGHAALADGIITLATTMAGGKTGPEALTQLAQTSGFKDAVTQYFKEAIGQGGQMAAQSVLSDLNHSANADQDIPAPQLVSDAVKSALSGAAMGVAFRGLHDVSSAIDLNNVAQKTVLANDNYKEGLKDLFTNIADDPDLTDDQKAQMKQGIYNGLTPAQRDYYENNWQSAPLVPGTDEFNQAVKDTKAQLKVAQSNAVTAPIASEVGPITEATEEARGNAEAISATQPEGMSDDGNTYETPNGTVFVKNPDTGEFEIQPQPTDEQKQTQPAQAELEKGPEGEKPTGEAAAVPAATGESAPGVADGGLNQEKSDEPKTIASSDSSNPGTEEAQGSELQKTASDLASGAGTIAPTQTISDADRQVRQSEIARQSQKIIEIAKSEGKEIPSESLEKLPLISENTGENDVYLDGDRVLKVSRDPAMAPAGYKPELRQNRYALVPTTATPSELLTRLDLANKVFGEDNKFEGVVIDDGKPKIVTSQTYIAPKTNSDGEVESIQQHEIDSYMQDHGFTPIPDFHAEPGEFEIERKNWSRPDGVVVTDVRPDNFIKDKEGGLNSIDLQIAQLHPDELSRYLKGGAKRYAHENGLPEPEEEAVAVTEGSKEQPLSMGGATPGEYEIARTTAGADIFNGLKTAQGREPSQEQWQRNFERVHPDLEQSEYDDLYRRSKEASDAYEAQDGAKPIAEVSRQMTEGTSEPGEPTSVKNSTVSEERMQRMLPAAVDSAKKDFKTVWDKVTRKIADEPTYTHDLVQSLKENPRAVTDEESAALLYHQIDLQARYKEAQEALNEAHDRGDEAAVVENRVRLANLSDQALDLYNVNKQVGTETGRGLNARKMMAREDYSLVNMIGRKRAANEGRELTPEESESVEKQSGEIEKAATAVEEHETAKDQERAEETSKETHKDIVAETPKGKPETDLDTKRQKIVDKIQAEADKGRDKKSMGGLVQRLAENLVRSGVKDREELIDRIHEILQKTFSDVTRRETMDAISGYGDFKNLSKDPIKAQVRDLKGQMQQLGKIEDMLAGQPPKKTGVERREASPTETVLIKKANELARKLGIKVTDPDKQLKSALDAFKKRTTNRIAELEEKLANGDYSRTPRKGPITLDNEGLRLKAKLQELKDKFEQGVIKDRMKNRTDFEKVQDNFVKWFRASILSNPMVIPKITMATYGNMLLNPVREAAGGVISKILPGIASRAPIEGGFSVKIEAKAVADAWSKMIQDYGDTLKTGNMDIDKLYGRANGLPPLLADYVTHIHAALHSTAKRTAFNRAMMKQAEFYASKGEDIHNPILQLRMSKEAFAYANREVFMENNRVVQAINAWTRAISRPDKISGKIPIGGKLVATATNALLPIKTVPTNIAARILQLVFGTATGAVRAAKAYADGIDKLSPEHADLIMRELKTGAVGNALMALGFFGQAAIGGFWDSSDKKKAPPGGTPILGGRAGYWNATGPTPYGATKIGKWTAPSWTGHNQYAQAAELGATIARVANNISKDAEGQYKKVGMTAAAWAALLGVIRDTPLAGATGTVANLLSGKGDSAGHLAGGAVPGALRFSAEELDRDANGNLIKRNPKGPVQNVESGIPGLRERVPVKH